MTNAVQPSQMPSAAAAAKEKTAEVVETLHQALQPSAKRMIGDFIKLHSTLRRQEASLKKLQDAAVQPNSARIKFEITGSKRVSEMTEFKTLQAETKTFIDEVQAALKQKIVQAAEFEIKATKQAIAVHLLDCIINLSKFKLTEASAADVRLDYVLRFGVDAAAVVKTAALIHAEAETPEEVRLALCARLGVAEDTQPSQMNGFVNIAMSAENADLVKQLFADVMDAYDGGERDRLKHVRLTKMVRGMGQEKANIDAMEVIAEEPTVAPATVQSIVDNAVRTSVQKQTASLRKLLSHPKGKGVALQAPRSPPRRRRSKHNQRSRRARRMGPQSQS